YVESRGLAPEKNSHLLNNLVYIHELPLRTILLEELAGPADDFRRALSVFHDSHGGRARLFEVWSVGREPAQAGISVGASCGDWLIHFVRQRSGQLSHGGHTVDACEIRLRLAQSLQRFLACFLSTAMLARWTICLIKLWSSAVGLRGS